MVLYVVRVFVYGIDSVLQIVVGYSVQPEDVM